MMLEPDPQLRATAEALLALPMLRQPRPWNVLWYMAAEALSRGWALWQALVTLLCWLWHGLVHPASWLQPPGPPVTPPGSPPCSPLLDSTLSSNWDDDSIGWVRESWTQGWHMCTSLVSARGLGPSAEVGEWASVTLRGQRLPV